MESAIYHKLLDAAQELVQTDGFNAFSYGNLSESVGIKTASIHYHFPRKEDMGEALARRYRERFNAVLDRIEAENPGAPERIEKYCEQFIQTLKQGGKICLCGMLASDYATLPEKVRKQTRIFFTENEEWLARILDQGRKSGAFDFDSEPTDIARTFFSTLEGAMIDARMFEDESRLLRAIDCWQKVFIGKA